jgi:hypothetical protein
MSMQVLYPYQGRQYNRVLQLNNLNGTPATNVFTPSTILIGNVWEGQNQPSLFQPTITWYNGTVAAPQVGYFSGQVMLSVAGTQTANLDPAGEYYLLIDTLTGGLTSPGWEGRIKILATPGSTSPSPPDLITYDYALSQLAILNLTDGQQDTIPRLVSAASNAIRTHCQDRYFDLRTGLVDWLDVPLDGYVRLYQVPVQQVTRVQGQPQLALTVANTSGNVQTAQTYFTFTGQVGGYGANAWTSTGLYLNWVSNGTPANATLLWSTYPTIGQLAAAVNAVGSGWMANISSPDPAWLCSELTGGMSAQGCTSGDWPYEGACFSVLADTQGRLDNPRTGLVWVGRQYENADAMRWGPGGREMFSESPLYNQLGKVKITYTAGFPIIPADVQFQTAQLVKWYLEMGKQELLLSSEKADEYEYKLAEEMVHKMPRPVVEALGRWVLHYA